MGEERVACGFKADPMNIDDQQCDVVFLPTVPSCETMRALRLTKGRQIARLASLISLE
jgi:hypothetical protein